MNRARRVPSVIVCAALTLVVLLGSGHNMSAGPPTEPPPVPTLTPPAEGLHLLQLEPLRPGTYSVAASPDAGEHEVSASTVRVTTHFTASADAEILQGYLTANCGDKDAPQIRAGYDTYQTPNARTVRSLVQFDLADVPSNATVQNATLELYVTSSYDVVGQSMTAIPYRVSSPWSEYAVTWGTQPGQAEGYGSDAIPYVSGQWAQFDVTGLVQGWVDGSYPNHGLVMQGRETSPGWRAFGSRNFAVSVGGGRAAWVAPRLALTYAYEPDYRLLLVPQQHALRSGESVSSALYLHPVGLFDDDATLAVDGLPPGATYSLSPSTLSPLDAATLTISTLASTPGGTHPFTVRGQADGKPRTVQGMLKIARPGFEMGVSPTARTVGRTDEVTFTVSITSTEGFDQPVTLSVGGLPPETEHGWSQNPVTPPPGAPPTADVQLTIATGPGTPNGVYTGQITGTAGSLVQSVPFELTVSDPTFELGLSPAGRSVAPGGSARYEVTVSKVGAFEGSVSLQAGGLPAGATPQWSQNPVTPTATSALTVQTAPHTPVGEHTFVVTGTHAQITSVLSGTLAVRPHTLYLPLLFNAYEQTGSRTGQGAHPGSTAVPKIALLIGVSRYKETGAISTNDEREEDKNVNLATTNADMMGFGDEIIEDGGRQLAAGLQAAGFEPQNVKLLLDSQATKGAIHDAIVNWIDPLEDEDTLVVIFYSGHGMQAPDDDGDENDAYDEFIVPFGIDVTIRPTPLQRAIRDDELAAWLDELESQNVVLIADTCFSGGMVPSAIAGRVKSLSPYVEPLASPPTQVLSDGFVQDIGQSGRLILMASAENQYSLESIELGHGVFSYYLLEALRSPSADQNGNGWISAEEAFTYLRPRVRSYTSSAQSPQVVDGVVGQADLVPVRAPAAACPSWQSR